MQNVLTIENTHEEREHTSFFAMDTTFVLFFLAVEMGTTSLAFDTGSFLAVITLLMFIAVPYLLPFSGERPAFLPWAAGRSAIALIGLVGGVAIGAFAGTLLPEAVRFVPMWLLIAAAFFSGYSQLYVIMRSRLAR